MALTTAYIIYTVAFRNSGHLKYTLRLLKIVKSSFLRMKKEIIEKLAKLNEEFYRQIAKNFDSSRQYSWEGWEKFWNKFYKDSSPKSILDVGCGNGRFVSFLNEHTTDFSYQGIDSSFELLKLAEERYKSPTVKFHQANLLSDWKVSGKFDLIVAFGLMHHIPDFETRVKLLKRLKSFASKNSRIIFSVWKFLDNDKQKGKIVDWSKVYIANSDIEENDYLLSWKRGEIAYRYCHYYSDHEVERILSAAGLKIEDSYFADGKDGKLNKYFIVY
jgi:tRNA (uracil-5-)-methyltransferase TRM9